MSGAEAFVAEYAIVATWGNVTFLGISEKDLEKRPVSLFLYVCCYLAFIDLFIMKTEKLVPSGDSYR